MNWGRLAITIHFSSFCALCIDGVRWLLLMMASGWALITHKTTCWYCEFNLIILIQYQLRLFLSRSKIVKNRDFCQRVIFYSFFRIAIVNISISHIGRLLTFCYFMDITYVELPAIPSSFVLCIECSFDKNCNKT